MTVVTSRLSGATEGAAVLSNVKGAVSE
jgi:hypothetical protein